MTRKRIALIDHFDSFVYNLACLLERAGAQVDSYRTDRTIEEVTRSEPSHIVLSPGPGHPQEVTLFQQVIAQWKGRLPILGVCLGHQAIALHFGAWVRRTDEVMHGKISAITHEGDGIFRALPSLQTVCRYHSLVVDRETLPGELTETAWSDDGTLMGIRSRAFPDVIGVQHHPESLFSDGGAELMRNFLHL